jgi:uncharacterized membrane protein YjjP (DUF1212 family)
MILNAAEGFYLLTNRLHFSFHQWHPVRTTASHVHLAAGYKFMIINSKCLITVIWQVSTPSELCACLTMVMSTEERRIKDVGSLLLEVGNLLMCSGASTARVRMTINRISEALGFTTNLFITHRALMLTISDTDQEQFLSSLKRVAPHGANFKVISGISRMSWRIVEEHWELDRIRNEVKRLSDLPHYRRWLVLLVVALAGASFCRLFGGNYIEMLVTFAASFMGLFVRQQASARHFNQYLCVFFAAFTASFIAGSFKKFGVNMELEHAFATSVLFLVPGIPLINTFSDIIDGNILNGVIRGVHGLTVAVAISLGMLTTILIYHFQ